MNDVLSQLHTGQIIMRPTNTGKKVTWQLRNCDPKLTYEPEYTLEIPYLVGFQKLSGGSFTSENAVTTAIIGEEFASGKLESSVDFAGRHVNQSYLLSAQRLIIELGHKSSKPNQFHDQ